MAARKRGKQVGMRMIEEIRRLHAMGLSRRNIAKSLNCSRNTVDKYLVDPAIEDRGKPEYHAPWSGEIDWELVNGEVNRGTPLSEVWENSVGCNNQSPPYVSFWREYKRRFPDIRLDFHKNHPPGERCEVDYKGDSPGLGYIDRQNGEFIPCRLYGAVLCFSQLFFPYATHSEKKGDILTATAKAFQYFGGVPMTCVIDNAKTLVTRAHQYDPDLNKEFALFCAFHGTAPIATRPAKPKDKNLIENALGVFWRWARRRIRGRTFFSLGELNLFIKELADDFNARIQRKYGLSRRQKFEHGERDKLLPLPDQSYRYGEWKLAKLHPDCHIQIEMNFYSAPYQLRGKQLDVRISQNLIEVFHDLERVATHPRAVGRYKGRYYTNLDHLPPAHLAMLEATPANLLEAATEVGPATRSIVENLINGPVHPLTHLRRVQGILRLAKRYSPPALENACAKVLSIGIANPRLRDIEDIISAKLNPKSADIIPIRQKPNEFLRGQQSWAQPYNFEEERN